MNGEMRRIAVTSSGMDMDSQLDERFGRCAYLIIVDSEGTLVKVLENKAVDELGGSGVKASTLLVENNVDTVLTGNIGPHAFKSLKASGIEIYEGAFGTVKKAVSDLLMGRSEKHGSPTNKGLH